MSKQPEALRLADVLEMGSIWQDQEAAAAELRRLHAENEAAHAVGIRQEQELMDCEALLRQALRLLDFYAACYGVAKSDMPTITALRERLGESA